jgi:hypothetical protein
MTSGSAPPLPVVDTDVLIDDLRDQPQAVSFLEGTEQPLAPAVRPQPRHRPGGCADRRLC